MKITELRIGNIVLLKETNEPLNILGLFKDLIEIYRGAPIGDIRLMGMSYFEPVPLTEEWLTRLGFEKFNDKGDYWSYEGLKLWMHDENKFYHINSEIMVYIDHVHQLQNLYFALTRNELVLDVTPINTKTNVL